MPGDEQKRPGMLIMSAGPGGISTVTCRLCGAIIALRLGDSPNPTDKRELHVIWHRKHGEVGV